MPVSPPSGAATLGRVILRDQIRDVLLRRVISGEYPPGSRLVETRIAQELGVSQTPVREALRDLEQLGCVVHESFRGCSVREFSVDDLLEAFPVRAALECAAVELAVARITDEEVAELEAAVERMRVAGDAGDDLAESTADAEFHATIVGAAGNAVLTRQWEQLQPHARTLLSISLPASLNGSIADRHLPILEALRDRDAVRGVAAMREHLADAAERLRPQKLSQPTEESP